ncbi:MAG: hypothetical protein H6R19_1989 [Proteobacteria bacterium]|nr:hypothetical protein [Pseudomonadota bacterium]
MKRSLLLMMLCASACTVQAEVFKWVDAEGKIQYGDDPPKNVKAQKISGGVTVVPAIVVPAAASAPQGKTRTEAVDEGTRGAISRKPESVSAAASAPAELTAAARAEARQKAIELCQQNRGSNCENEVDAQLYGLSGTVFVPVPGWSQPPIRPIQRHVPEPKPQQSATATMSNKDRKLPQSKLKPASE